MFLIRTPGLPSHGSVYFVVRARDAAGIDDQNSHEVAGIDPVSETGGPDLRTRLRRCRTGVMRHVDPDGNLIQFGSSRCGAESAAVLAALLRRAHLVGERTEDAAVAR